MAEPLNLGFCGICETKIWEIKNNRQIPNELYSEIFIALSNGTIAVHAICRNCTNNLTDEKIDALLERIKASWYDEMVGTSTKKDFDRVDKLKMETYDLDPKKAEEKYKIKKQKDKEDELKPK